MEKFKIVSDSSCDFFEFEGVDFQSVPLKIISGNIHKLTAPDCAVRAIACTVKGNSYCGIKIILPTKPAKY